MGTYQRASTVRREHTPERGNADLSLGTSRLRPAVSVDRVDQPVNGDNAIGAEQQSSQDDLLTGGAELKRPSVSADLKGSQDPKLHRISSPYRRQPLE
jgi:hypothetical protein